MELLSELSRLFFILTTGITVTVSGLTIFISWLYGRKIETLFIKKDFWIGVYYTKEYIYCILCPMLVFRIHRKQKWNMI